jgi:hypothetical protein
MCGVPERRAPSHTVISQQYGSERRVVYCVEDLFKLNKRALNTTRIAEPLPTGRADFGYEISAI